MSLNKIELSILSIIMVSKWNVLQLICCSWPILRAWKKPAQADHCNTCHWSNKSNAFPSIFNFKHTHQHTHTHSLILHTQKNPLKKPWRLLWPRTTEVISPPMLNLCISLYLMSHNSCLMIQLQIPVSSISTYISQKQWLLSNLLLYRQQSVVYWPTQNHVMKSSKAQILFTIAG